MPRSVAVLSASRTRSSESIRPATYIVVTGTSARSASTTELRPATISLRRLAPTRTRRGRRWAGTRLWTSAAGALWPRRGHLVRPCGSGARRPWASGPCPRGRGGAGRRSRLWRPSSAPLRTAPRRWELPAMVFLSAVGATGERPVRSRGGVFDDDAGGTELVADRVRGGEVAGGPGGRAGLELDAARGRRGRPARRWPRSSGPPSQCGSSGLTPSRSVMATTAANAVGDAPRRHRRRGRCCRRGRCRGPRRARPRR